MFGSYIKIAVRSLCRNKINSSINIGGLAVGMAVAFLIGLWIFEECLLTKNLIISCLGLLGLSSFNTTLRTKEIGIRKVLGASSAGIVQLLKKEFFSLVIIAFFIASPIAWILMNHWLNDFPYRINISLLYFVMAGSLALLIAFFTISFQAIKAAIVNPVESLRSE